MSSECQGFEGAAARIVLKLVMMTTRGGNYCAGWEVIGGDLLREVSEPKPPGPFKALPGNLGWQFLIFMIISVLPDKSSYNPYVGVPFRPKPPIFCLGKVADQ